jgi:hypothetical protein
MEPLLILVYIVGGVVALIWLLLWFMVPVYIRDIKKATISTAASLDTLVKVEQYRAAGRTFFPGPDCPAYTPGVKNLASLKHTPPLPDGFGQPLE